MAGGGVKSGEKEKPADCPRTIDRLQVFSFGRSDWIRTSDPLTPSQVRYQAAPRSVLPRRFPVFLRCPSGKRKIASGRPPGKRKKRPHGKNPFFSGNSPKNQSGSTPCATKRPVLMVHAGYGPSGVVLRGACTRSGVPARSRSAPGQRRGMGALSGSDSAGAGAGPAAGEAATPGLSRPPCLPFSRPGSPPVFTPLASTPVPRCRSRARRWHPSRLRLCLLRASRRWRCPGSAGRVRQASAAGTVPVPPGASSRFRCWHRPGFAAGTVPVPLDKLLQAYSIRVRPRDRRKRGGCRCPLRARDAPGRLAGPDPATVCPVARGVPACNTVRTGAPGSRNGLQHVCRAHPVSRRTPAGPAFSGSPRSCARWA